MSDSRVILQFSKRPIACGSKSTGFTMVELIVVIVITGIIAAIMGVFIVRPIQGYDAQVRRAELVDAAENALRRMQREIRRALPNSIRIVNEGNGNGRVLELLRTIDGGRYRERPPGNATARLDFNAPDTDFDMHGHLLCTDDATINGPCNTYSGHWLVIYNLGQPGADAYAGTDVITPTGTVLTVTSNGAIVDPGVSDHINLNPGFDFAFRSPSQRFFIIDTPVSYVCDTSAGTLTRYEGYNLVPNQTTIDTNAELGLLAQGSLVADNIDAAGCTITYQAGASERAGLVTIALTIRDPGSNEPIRLLQQVHVDNVP